MAYRLPLAKVQYHFSRNPIYSFLGRVLPDQQLNNDAKDIVKLATGLIATLSALVVSLLYSYAKGTFNQVNGFNIPDLAQGVLTALPQTVKHRKIRCVIEIWSDALRSKPHGTGSNLRPI